MNKVGAQSESSNALGWPVIIAAAVIAIAVLGAIAWHFFAPPRTAAIATSGDSKTQWLSQKALECHGDFRQLSQDDQNKVVAQYGVPDGPRQIAMLYDARKGGQ